MVARIDDRLVEGIIDLVVDTADGLVVVDYKTDSARSATEIAAKVAHYTPQLRAYAKSLALATGLAVAPPQLDPEPAVQPKQCRRTTISRSASAAGSKSRTCPALEATGRSSIWLKSQS